MHIAKKQLLGFGGLAFVVALTAFATTLPTGATSVGGNVEVKVQVYGANFETLINKPLDSEVYSTAEIDFSETHSHAYRVDYVLERLNADGSVAETYSLDDYTVIGEDVSGNTEFKLNMNDYGGPGIYVFRSTITSQYGGKKEDAVQFIYAAISADQDDVVATATKVDFNVKYTAGVKSLTYVLRDSQGNDLTDVFTTNTTSPETGGSVDLSIDLTELGLQAGEYTIYIVGYDGLSGKGDVIDVASVYFRYSPEAPNVPDTGSLLSALNISRADYLITGLIVFVTISIAALIVVRRAHKKNQ